MDWQDSAQRLWGEEFIAPMSEVLMINRRTIERWKAGEGQPSNGIQVEMMRLAMRAESREIGTVLRRMANGTTLDEIDRDIRNQQVAARRVRTDLGKFNAISVLAAGQEAED